MEKKMDPLTRWYRVAHTLNRGSMIFANLGKPTYPLSKDLIKANQEYWQKAGKINYNTSEASDLAKETMAHSLSKWYETTIKPEDVIFTVGGSFALDMIKRSLVKDRPVATPVPYYPPYRTFNLSSRAEPHALLLCDPTNPTGQLVDKTIVGDIEGPIILDESYAELCFKRKHTSLFTQLPAKRQQMLVIRSATKGFSASGDRIGLILCQNAEWRERLMGSVVISGVQPPISGQVAYAYAMSKFTEHKRAKLAEYYADRVNYGLHRLKTMGLELQSSVDAGIYVLADLSCLLSDEWPTDEALCYKLAEAYQIALAPLSFFGVEPTLGHVRITCSGNMVVLAQLFKCIEHAVTFNRELRTIDVSYIL